MKVRVRKGAHPYSGKAVNVHSIKRDRHGLVTVGVWPEYGSCGIRFYDKSEVDPLDDEARAALEQAGEE